MQRIVDKSYDFLHAYMEYDPSALKENEFQNIMDLINTFIIFFETLGRAVYEAEITETFSKAELFCRGLREAM